METIARRDLLKGAAAASIVACAAPALCRADETEASASSDDQMPFGLVARDIECSAVELDPITEFAAEETYDIVVVGAGCAGVPAVMTALEEGATVGCLQKEEKASANGSGCSAFIKGQSTVGGLARVESDWIKANNWRCNRTLFDYYMAHGEETISWIIQKAFECGADPAGFDTTNSVVYDDGEVAANMKCRMQSNQILMEAMAARAEELGAVIHYGTPAVQLVQDESGAVTGVVGKAADGSYVKMNATKGVILAAGDYMNNDSLFERYSGDCASCKFDRRQVNRTGDGHILGSLAGGFIVPANHAKQIHDLAVTSNTMMGVPFLMLDAQGKRFFDEECTMTSWNLPLKYHYPNQAPVMFRFFDSKYAEKFSMCGNLMSQEALDEKAMTEYEHNAKGIYRADTIEELCAMWEVDPAPFVESINRYNELCAKGVDEDFGKDPQYMTPIDTPPFYGLRYSPGLAAINGGLTVDEHYQVVDRERNPIPGLFAAGVCGGDICGGTDWLMPGGASNGHCFNAGRYTVIYALTGGLEPSNPCTFDQVADYFKNKDGEFNWNVEGGCNSAIELW